MLSASSCNVTRLDLRRNQVAATADAKASAAEDASRLLTMIASGRCICNGSLQLSCLAVTSLPAACKRPVSRGPSGTSSPTTRHPLDSTLTPAAAGCRFSYAFQLERQIRVAPLQSARAGCSLTLPQMSMEGIAMLARALGECRHRGVDYVYVHKEGRIDGLGRTRREHEAEVLRSRVRAELLKSLRLKKFRA